MAGAKDSTYSDFKRDKLLSLAKKYQQNYYELLPDWYEYYLGEYQYLRQNIGFALFGPPQTNENKEGVPTIDACCTSNINQDVDLINEIKYDEKACKIIDAIYNKVLEYGRRSGSDPIYFGIIYNIVFYSKVLKKSDANSGGSSQESHEIYAVPIFKVKKCLDEQKVGAVHEPMYTTWYIDSNVRTYKNWVDYTTKNTLPKCTMVLPKNGFYQCDPCYKITEKCSTVWVEILESPACGVGKTVLKVLDTASNVLGIGAAVAVGVASFLTPVGPMLTLAGLATGGISGSWTIGRCSQQLVDRSVHKQSIGLNDRNAVSAWLGIAGSALGIGASGGAVLLSRAIAAGSSVNAVAKIAYNSVVIGNLTINGIGVVYQGCCLIENYREKREVDFVDIFMFTSHVLFFSNAVLNAKLAGELIGSSRGTILERFKNSLRFDRLRREFSRTTENAGPVNPANQSESSGIIRKIKKILSKGDLISGQGEVSLLKSKSVKIHFENGKIKMNNITILDPVLFAGSLLTSGNTESIFVPPGASLKHKEVSDVMSKLKHSLTQLLTQYYSENKRFSTNQLPDTSYFHDILNELKYVNDANDLLFKMFKIAVIVIQNCNEPEKFLVEAVRFIWKYLKANLKEYKRSNFENTPLHNILNRIVTTICEIIDVIADELFNAFYTYMLKTEPLNCMG